jgi:formamidopyrimidine-DNA glycosylase
VSGLFCFNKKFSYTIAVMPELPEVETVRLQLLRKVVGKTIARVEVLHPKSVGHNLQINRTLTGETIAHIDRVGKLLLFSFTNNKDILLLAHLKMTGQFFFVDSKGGVSGGGHSLTPTTSTHMPNRHTRVAYHFTDNSTLYFNDMRLFGFTKLASPAEAAAARARFGPEPIDEHFDITWFITTLRRKHSVVKAALLDQTFIAGLGNIYVDEALWRAQVRPTRRANKLTRAEASLVAQAAGAVMRESILVGGTTFQHFADTGGDAGNFTDYLNVFGKQGTACSRCGTEIVKIRAAGRGTHYCPGCQK